MGDNTQYFKEIVENIRKDADLIAQDAYQKGLNDAWERVKTLEDMSASGKWNDFYCSLSFHDFLGIFTASEALEKLRSYEEGKNKIQVGDEVESFLGEKYIVYKLSDDEKTAYGLDLTDYPVKQNVFTVSKAKKTGRHFDAVKTLFEMLEGNE